MTLAVPDNDTIDDISFISSADYTLGAYCLLCFVYNFYTLKTNFGDKEKLYYYFTLYFVNLYY